MTYSVLHKYAIFCKWDVINRPVNWTTLSTSTSNVLATLEHTHTVVRHVAKASQPLSHVCKYLLREYDLEKPST